jgi:hypothetical protein
VLAQKALKKKKNNKDSEIDDDDDDGDEDVCDDDELEIEKEERMEQMLELCLSFEEITGYRNITPKEIPSKICGEIAVNAHHLADVISSSIDIQSIKRSLYQQVTRNGGGGGGGGSVDGSEDIVNELKKEMIQKTIQSIQKKLNETSPPTPGSLQQEARNMFMNKIQQALSLAMTKHDQVHISASSVFSLFFDCSFVCLVGDR